MPDPEPMVVEEEKEEEVEISMPIEETKEEQLPLIGTETNVLMTLAATVDEGSVAQSIDDGLPADFYLQVSNFKWDSGEQMNFNTRMLDSKMRFWHFLACIVIIAAKAWVEGQLQGKVCSWEADNRVWA